MQFLAPRRTLEPWKDLQSPAKIIFTLEESASRCETKNAAASLTGQVSKFETRLGKVSQGRLKNQSRVASGLLPTVGQSRLG